jgi:hypothetical protein
MKEDRICDFLGQRASVDKLPQGIEEIKNFFCLIFIPLVE